VNVGGSHTFTFQPNAGYEVDRVTVDGSNVSFSGNTYTFNNVQANHTISVTFKALPPAQYTITASAGANGSILPGGSVSVNTGGSQTFIFQPNAGYEVDQVKVDGSNVSFSNNSYTFNSVQANHTISVTFKALSPTQYTITASDDAHSAISPFGAVSVSSGGSLTFTWSFDTGYETNRLLVDNSSASVYGSSHTFTNVTSDHTIAISSKATVYTITYSLNGGSGVSNRTYTIEDAAITLPAPTKAGNTFQGWYVNAGFSGSPVTVIPAGSTGNRTFHARWKDDTKNENTVEPRITVYSGVSTLIVKSTVVIRSISVYTVTGNPVRLEKVNSAEARINNLSRGIYIVKTVLEGGKTEIRKVSVK
jgi:uncharacterized repeat protein (TIGR02543 family)